MRALPHVGTPTKDDQRDRGLDLLDDVLVGGIASDAKRHAALLGIQVSIAQVDTKKVGIRSTLGPLTVIETATANAGTCWWPAGESALDFLLQHPTTPERDCAAWD